MSDNGSRSPITADEILGEVWEEMRRQDQKWGWPQVGNTLDDDPGLAMGSADLGDEARRLLDDGPADSPRPWLAILAEELGEVAEEVDPGKRAEELVQVAAVALSWVQAIREAA